MIPKIDCNSSLAAALGGSLKELSRAGATDMPYYDFNTGATKVKPLSVVKRLPYGFIVQAKEHSLEMDMVGNQTFKAALSKQGAIIYSDLIIYPQDLKSADVFKRSAVKPGGGLRRIILVQWQYCLWCFRTMTIVFVWIIYNIALDLARL